MWYNNRRNLIFSRFMIRLSNEDAEKMIIEADTNKDGKVSYEEYLAFMMKM